MTRAAERLVVCGAQGVNKIPDGCWYSSCATRSKTTASASRPTTACGEVLRYRKGEPEPLRAVGGRRAGRRRRRAGLADAATRRVETPSLRTVTPSSSDDETRRARRRPVPRRRCCAAR